MADDEPADLTIPQVVNVWNTAITMIDSSELRTRDVIERDLANVAGVQGITVGEVMMAAKQTAGRVGRIRSKAIKQAFRYLRYELKNPKILERSLAQWAKAVVDLETKRIDNTIRVGLIGGLDNSEIARRMIGSLQLRGVDGATEVTRQHLVRLGRAAMKPLSRKSGSAAQAAK